MKRIILTIAFMLLATVAYAGTITVDPFLVSADVTIAHLDTFRSTVVDAINNADGGNISAGTITSTQLDANTNPENRWNEAFNDFVYTGLLPVTSASLTSTTSAGTGYIYGARVVKVDTNKTYTASKDTYVDLSKTGTYTYSEVALGGTEPAIAANSIRLAKVTTTGTTVSTVRDDRVTAISLGTNDDPMLFGLEVRIATGDATVATIDAGVCYNGTTRVDKITKTAINLSTAADWWDGVADTYAGGAGWCYIGVSSSSTIKFLGANPPDKSDTAGNANGRLIYWYDGSAYWRVIGAIRVNTSNNIARYYVQDGNYIGYLDAANESFLVVASGTQTSFTDVDCTAFMPAYAERCKIGVTPVSTNLDTLAVRKNGQNESTGTSSVAIDTDYTAIDVPAVTDDNIFTDSSQIFEYKVSSSDSADIFLMGYYQDL